MRHWKSVVLFVTLVTLALGAGVATAAKKKNPLEAWKPKFDPSGAKYVMKVSNISHPALEGIGVGYKIRDRLWKETNGQLYFDYYPLAQLGGEVEVMNQLVMGAIQGQIVSSVAVTNIAPRMGIVNLPFLINSYDKLEKFAADKELYDYFLAGAEDKGIIGLDVSGYGNYGWGTTTPVKTLADAKGLKFRIAEAAVQQSLYKAWGLNAVVMPWPDVAVSLKQGVIDGLDHAAIVCSLTRKFEVAKYYTFINYAQGLFIHLVNKAWFDSLPKDIQETLVRVTKEECAKSRIATRDQEYREIGKSVVKGVKFYHLPEKDMATLRKEGQVVFKEWADKIGPDYLKKVEDLMGYKM